MIGSKTKTFMFTRKWDKISILRHIAMFIIIDREIDHIIELF